MSEFQIFPDPYLLIRASAGTGKTYQLSGRYIALLHHDADVGEILGATFTKKAAGEILERILLRVAKAIDDEKERRDLCEQIGVGEVSADRFRELLMRLVKNLHRIRVSTLDGYFGSLATSYSPELGLPIGWQIADDENNRRHQQQAIESLLENNRESDVVRVMHMVGRGDGDRDIAPMIERKVESMYQAFREADEQAWQKVARPQALEESELAGLLDQLEGSEIPAHQTIKKAHAQTIQLAAAEDWEAIIKKGIPNRLLEGESTMSGKEIPPQTLELYSTLVSHIRAVLSTHLSNQNQGSYELLKHYDAASCQLRLDTGRLSFDDVAFALAPREATSEFEDRTYRTDGTIRHLLLDEFQDTSVVQWQIIAPLASQIANRKTASFFCVGDVKQAIYGWRGGEARIFDVLKEFVPTLQEDSLQKSFRSAQPIIDVTNQIFANLTKHDNLGDYTTVVRRWSRGFEKHETAWALRKGHVTLETALAADEAEKQSDVTLRYAAKRVADLYNTIPGRKIGVLTRGNEAVSRMIYELGELSILASEEGGRALTDSAAVQILLSLLTWIDHPSHTGARFHVASSPLGARLSLGEKPAPSERREIGQRLSEELLTDGYGPTIAKWAAWLLPHSSKREANRLNQLVDLAYKYEPSATLRPGDFAEYVRNEKVHSPEPVRVRVMTLHQAKGLEFDIVVLPELDVNLAGQPNDFAIARSHVVGPITQISVTRNKHVHRLLSRSTQNMFEEAVAQNVREALCRLYVGVTRAAYALHMIIAPANDKSLPKKTSGLLRAALVGNDPIGPGEVLYEHGDPNWHEHENEGLQPEKDGDPSGGDAEPLAVKLAPSSRKGTTRTWKSPTGLHRAGQEMGANVFRADRRAASTRGNVVHAWCEELEWLEDGLPPQNKLEQIAGRLGMPLSHVAQEIQAFQNLLSGGQIANVLSRETYQAATSLGFDRHIEADLSSAPLDLRVCHETPAYYRSGKEIVGGKIDRLVLMICNGNVIAADVLDFKTDRIEGVTTVEQRVAAHRSQLDAYRNAVAQMFRLDPQRVGARLLFTDVGIVRSLESDSD